jgi:succinate dehydrogenase / fumarate reductase flavoprotein subunit
MAAAEGKKVVLMSKGKAGRSGNAIMVGGGFGIDGYSTKYVLGEEAANEAYTPDKLMERVITHSFYLSDQKLARQFVTDAPPMMKIFLRWAEAAGQKFLFAAGGGLYAVSGKAMGMAIGRGIRETQDLTVFHDVMAIDLLKQGERIAGAVGLDMYSGEYIHVEAAATVLATGGYQPYSLKNTITDTTGDGAGMALRAGARVADMEFLLYIPTAVAPSYLRGSILPYLFTIPVFMPLPYHVTDAKGNRIELPVPFNRMPGTNKAMKLVYSSFWSQGADASVDTMRGGLFYDYSERSEKEITDAFDHFLRHYSHWHRKGMYNGIDVLELRDRILKERKLEFALGNEYSNGGVVVDETMATDLPGLFAAGEVTSGLFGAFRAGDGLSEMLAHGYRAGISAATFAEENGMPADTAEAAARIVEEVESVFMRKGELRAESLLIDAAACADRDFGIIRNQAGLDRGLHTIRAVRTEQMREVRMPDESRHYNLDLYYYLELRNLLLCTEAGMQAASERRESRGTHYRSDCRAVNNREFFCRIAAKLRGGVLSTQRIVPDTGEMGAPTKNYDTVQDYLQEIIT